MPKEPKGRDRRLETQEESKLLEALKKTIVGDMAGFALETAMHRSEIVHMYWKDVSLTRRTVHIQETQTAPPERYHSALRLVTSPNNGELYISLALCGRSLLNRYWPHSGEHANEVASLTFIFMTYAMKLHPDSLRRD